MHSSRAWLAVLLLLLQAGGEAQAKHCSRKSVLSSLSSSVRPTTTSVTDTASSTTDSALLSPGLGSTTSAPPFGNSTTESSSTATGVFNGTATGSASSVLSSAVTMAPELQSTTTAAAAESSASSSQGDFTSTSVSSTETGSSRSTESVETTSSASAGTTDNAAELTSTISSSESSSSSETSAITTSFSIDSSTTGSISSTTAISSSDLSTSESSEVASTTTTDTVSSSSTETSSTELSSTDDALVTSTLASTTDSVSISSTETSSTESSTTDDALVTSILASSTDSSIPSSTETSSAEPSTTDSSPPSSLLITSPTESTASSDATSSTEMITSSSASSSTSDTTPSVPTQTLIFQAFALTPGTKKRGANPDVLYPTGGFIGVNGGASSAGSGTTCKDAAAYILSGEELLLADGATVYGIDETTIDMPGDPVVFGAPQQTGSITKSFSVTDAGVLRWRNAFFPFGEAFFYQSTVSSQVFVAWDGVPSNSVEVSIRVYKREQCQSDGTLKEDVSTTSSAISTTASVATTSSAPPSQPTTTNTTASTTSDASSTTSPPASPTLGPFTLVVDDGAYQGLEIDPVPGSSAVRAGDADDSPITFALDDAGLLTRAADGSYAQVLEKNPVITLTAAGSSSSSDPNAIRLTCMAYMAEGAAPGTQRLACRSNGVYFEKFQLCDNLQLSLVTAIANGCVEAPLRIVPVATSPAATSAATSSSVLPTM